MDATNQALEGIKGQNVGNVFKGLHGGEVQGQGGGYHHQQPPLLSDTALKGS